MRIVYVISDIRDYDKIIAGDTGPRFAADYDWPCCRLSELDAASGDFFVFDPLLFESEIEAVRTTIQNRSEIFLIRLIDTNWDIARFNPLYKLSFEMIDHPRLHFLQTYSPSEVTALLASRARYSQFVFAPYVYQPGNELTIENDERSRRVLVSGAMNDEIYPLRSRMVSDITGYPPLLEMSEVLLHPGYPGFPGYGDVPRHEFVRENYLRHLARFSYGIVCSSRGRLELLKYREFAYAGVIPVGDMPATLLDAPEESWIPWRGTPAEITDNLKTLEGISERANSFRTFMRSRRSAKTLRDNLKVSLERL